MTPLRFAANISFLYPDRPLLARIDAAKAAGFAGVEMLFPYGHSARGLRDRLDAAGLPCVLFNTPCGDWAAGERGFAAVPGAEARFMADLEQALAYAEILTPERIHIMAGNATSPASRAVFVENLARACAAAPGQTFTIEALNPIDAPGYHLSTVETALEVLDAVAAPNLGLQFDLYHTQRAQGDIQRRIAELAPRIVHVQIAGAPKRNEPDRGELDMASCLRALQAAGYTGWVGCEYQPEGDTDAGLAWRTRVADALGWSETRDTP